MGWRNRLLTLALLGLLISSGGIHLVDAASAAAAPRCSREDIEFGTCSTGTLIPGGAAVGANTTGAANGDASEAEWTPPPGWFFCNARWQPPENRTPGLVCRDEYTVTGPPVPTLDDVREFYPATTTISSEPNGWAVRGLPTNLIVDSSAHTRSGTVLGLPAEVAFTPTAVRWDYGDGTTATTTAGGAPWAQLRQPRFSDTGTSHIYRSRGEVTVTGATDYIVTYRFGTGPWRTIAGTLSIPIDPVTLRVVVGSTVLVDQPCTRGEEATC